jgi:ribosomal protein L7Ae-like RNA K-turn-binding protein
VTKLYSYLGLAQRAGKLVSGEEAVEAAVRRGRVRLVIIAADASSNTKAKFSNMAGHRRIDYVLVGDKDTLGKAIGKPQRAVIGVVDRGFASLIRGLVEEKN